MRSTRSPVGNRTRPRCPRRLQPGTFCRANSSARGTSPKTRTIRSRTSSGFRECSRRGVPSLVVTPVPKRRGLPHVASRHGSAFAWVQ